MISPRPTLQNAPVALYVPLLQAVPLYGVSDAMLRRLCRAKRVDAVKHGGTWLVNVAAPRQPGTRGPVPAAPKAASQVAKSVREKVSTSPATAALDSERPGDGDAQGFGDAVPEVLPEALFDEVPDELQDDSAEDVLQVLTNANLKGGDQF